MLKGSYLNNASINCTKEMETKCYRYYENFSSRLIGKFMLCLQKKQTQLMRDNLRNAFIV